VPTPWPRTFMLTIPPPPVMSQQERQEAVNEIRLLASVTGNSAIVSVPPFPKSPFLHAHRAAVQWTVRARARRRAPQSPDPPPLYAPHAAL